MGFMWTNKKVTVNCTKNEKTGYMFTLVNNETGEAKEFINSGGVLNFLVEHYGSAAQEVEHRVNAKFDEWKKEKEEADKWRTFRFYVKRDIGPFVINQFGSSPQVKSWQVYDSNAFGKNDIVVVEYVADKQILFQTPDGVAVEL